MFSLFSKKLFAIAFFLSLATAILHLSSQFFNRYQPVGMYGERGGFDGMMPIPEPVISVQPRMLPDEALDVEQRLYSTSSFSQLVVRDVSGYVERLRSSILSQDGRVLSSSIEKYGRYTVGNISARVPSEKVASVLTTIKEGVVTVVTERTSIEDETGQYVNLADKIEKLKNQISQLEADLASTESGGYTGAARRQIEQKLQLLQSQLSELESSKDSAEKDVEYARIDVSVADGARYFDPSARPSVSELLDSGWSMLGVLLSFVWRTAILTALYMLVWLPTTFALAMAFKALKTK